MTKWDMTKWQFKMNYCKVQGTPPAQEWAWDEAEKAYNSRIKLTMLLAQKTRYTLAGEYR